MAEKKEPKQRWKRILLALGPGIITGAADDDPAGIVTYSMAGAKFGTALLWLAPVAWPLMTAVQDMCARVGLVTGGGLMDALSKKFPRGLLLIAAAALFLANTFNVGADLAGMADALGQFTPVSSKIWVALLGLSIAAGTIFLRYVTLKRVLTFLTLALLAYVGAAFTLHPDWGSVARAAVIPHLPGGAWSMITAILGTTISPYLFFWQASQEIEEQKARGKKLRSERLGASKSAILLERLDVTTGTFAASLAFFFITLTAALTLHAHGITAPQTSREIASALRPIAGHFAAGLFTIGILGTGALAIPTLAGSAAYAFAELAGWREGMDEKPRQAPAFYAVFTLSIAAAVAMDFGGFNAVKAMYLSAIVNGILSPFLLVGVLVVASDRALMQNRPIGWLARVIVGFTTLAMFGCAIGLAL